MRKINNILTLMFTILLSLAITNNRNTDPISKLPEIESMTFTLSGTVTSNHPDLSWTTVPGANLYELKRLPVPWFGSGKTATFSFGSSTTSYVDADVQGAVLGSGFQEVRYTIGAYYEGVDNGVPFKYLLDSDGSVKYTATSID